MTSVLGIISSLLAIVAAYYSDFTVGIIFVVGSRFYAWEVYNGRDVIGME